MRHRWKDGYHFGVLCCALTVGTVLLINIIVTIAVGAKNRTSAGFVILRDGDCEKIKHLNTWLHLPINILSTLLLGASNYSMQCLCAPTRQDLDDAHRQHKWMDIGVPSVRNILRISWSRKILWGLLFISSVPIHLLYNSIIFSSNSVSEVTAFAVTSDFLAGAPVNATQYDEFGDGGTFVPASINTFSNPSVAFPNPSNAFPDSLASLTFRLERLRNSTSLVHLNNKDCLATYNKMIVSAWGDVLCISTERSIGSSLISTVALSDVSSTLEDDGGDAKFCNLDQFNLGESCATKGLPDPNNWTVSASGGVPASSGTISYCMAETAEEHCKMQFSMILMVIVIACNLVKVVCMGIIVWKLDSRPLVTIGDAIASFLESPDAATAGLCLATKSLLMEASQWTRRPHRYRQQPLIYIASASRTRWLLTTSLCIATLVAASYLLIMGNSLLGPPDSLSLGFGAINASLTFRSAGGDHNVLQSILATNSPQLLLSFLYFGYNSLWTCMLLAQEWSDYATHRKGLRVTSPSSAQRSTYRLQLPYRYGIPILVVSGILHWLASQSLFVVILDSYNFDGSSNPGDSVTRCGFSPIAILVTVIVGFIVLLTGIVNGFRRYPLNGMPLVGSCSAAISAACHPPIGDDQASTKPVMWGACGTDQEGNFADRSNIDDSKVSKEDCFPKRYAGSRKKAKVGHCSFTSFEVEKPVVGQLYAGLYA